MTNTQFEFPTYDYIAFSNQAPIPGILSSNAWVGYFSGGFPSVARFGASGTTNSLTLSPASNIYGLQYSSLELTLSNETIHFATLSPGGGHVSGYSNLPVYLGTAQPELETVDYYFGRPWIQPAPGYYYDGDPLPGYEDGSFAVTNTTPLMIGTVGQPMIIAGYAKQKLLNGNPNVFAYLGQYFTNALLMSNGVVTTNSAGILSEYGEFFPTVPGQIALMTIPDPDQTNIQGTCVVDIIRLSLDVNHDGIMDETYTGPDNTGYYTVLYNFWANNDYDRWHTDFLDGTVQDGLQSASQPDYDYTTNGNRAIPCPRDLEDYARLWVSGVSNTLSRLPTGSTVTLSWDNDYNYDSNGNPTQVGSPTIDLFQAADPDGGIGYLTNLTTASNQINTNLCQYVGRLGPGPTSC